MFYTFWRLLDRKEAKTNGGCFLTKSFGRAPNNHQLYVVISSGLSSAPILAWKCSLPTLIENDNFRLTNHQTDMREVTLPIKCNATYSFYWKVWSTFYSFYNFWFPSFQTPSDTLKSKRFINLEEHFCLKNMQKGNERVFCICHRWKHLEI